MEFFSHSLVVEHPESSERASGSVASGSAEHRLAPPVSQPLEAMRADSCGVGARLGTIQGMSGALDQANVAHTGKQLEFQIHQNYQRVEKNAHYLAGAKRFLAYLEGEQKSLAEVTKSDLEHWAATPAPSGKGRGNIPSTRIFQGGKALCAFAAQVGYIDPQRAKDIAGSTRPRFNLNELHMQLQNPALTPEASEKLILIGYQNADNQHHRQAGANGLLAYLKTQARSLAEVTINDLEQWSLTPVVSNNGNGLVTLPSARAFDGAKRLCALAAQVGYIDAHRARGLAECQRPNVDLNSLRGLLHNPALTPKEREHHIRLTYQSWEKNTNRQAGANSFLAFLERAEIALAEVSNSDLAEWALTPTISGCGKSNLPNIAAFEGAKALCALAAEVEHIDTQRAKEIAEWKRQHFDVELLRTILENPALTSPERDVQIRLNYQSLENDSNHQAGARGLVAYLTSRGKSLRQLTASDLQNWAITPIAKGKGMHGLPSVPAFQGAKALCALAAQVGEIDAQRAQEIAECPRPQGAVDSLHMLLQNPELTSKERDFHIRLQYQSVEKNAKRQAGANGFLAYLESRGLSLAEVSKIDLVQWALTPIGTGRSRGNLPSTLAFAGAKGLCAVAGEVGHLDTQTAKDIATCLPPHFEVHFLRSVLANPSLTSKECEHHIRLHYQSTEKNPYRQAGANGILAYLETTGSSLAELSKSDLEQWALTQIVAGRGRGSVPGLRAFEGAQALCALAAEVEYIDAQRAAELAECPYPQPAEQAPSTVMRSSEMLERANKRLRSDEQGASTSMSHSFALPQSDALFRELALSPPSLLDPQARSPQTGGLSLIDELENLEDILGSCGHLY